MIKKLFVLIVGRLVGSPCMRCGRRCDYDLCRDCVSAWDEALLIDD